jgi:dTDP-4-amino-4,6-dideoxygalactose transaminase
MTTPMTWVSTANVLLHAGARPVFVDVEPGTLNLDTALVEAAIGPRCVALLPVHFAGLPCNQRALADIARRRGLLVVEDAAHALGAEYDGRAIGRFGDATMFSFHAAKNITTGEGGALVTESKQIAERARRLRFHGIEPGGRFGGRGPASYEVLEAGFKYAMSDLQAAIGLHQLARLDAMNARRRELVELYHQGLAAFPHVAPLAAAPYPHLHARHLMVVQVDTRALAITRDELVLALHAEGVGAAVHFVPLHLQQLYRSTPQYPPGLPVATTAHERIVTLPLFPAMTASDVAMVLDALERTLRRHLRANRRTSLARETRSA